MIFCCEIIVARGCALHDSAIMKGRRINWLNQFSFCLISLHYTRSFYTVPIGGDNIDPQRDYSPIRATWPIIHIPKFTRVKCWPEAGIQAEKHGLNLVFRPKPNQNAPTLTCVNVFSPQHSTQGPNNCQRATPPFLCGKDSLGGSTLLPWISSRLPLSSVL